MSIYRKEDIIDTIIDTFENFLDDKKVYIENPERDAEDASNCANIYGDDYDRLADDIRRIYISNGINVGDSYDEGEDGNIIRLRNEFYKLVAENSPRLPDVGCFNVTLTDGSVNESYETQGDKASTEYSWSDFCDWLIGDIFEIYDIDQPNQLESISIVDIQFAGTDNMCS